MMTKKDSILAALRERSLNRFEAERMGDHCLPTTIAELRSEGHVIDGEWEEVPTRFGKSCRVKRYRLVGVQ
ncbi:helix-turn-helix domain-containing protein [Bordetella petrii]|uniref:helix-turn-helix domain-containing protein n=1 Tax=Bordetella petrii TaxID=94624 RepID=UPI00048B2E51|nr:helix-turn-helix domain-containing protein [Bordetella petrii]